MELEVVMENTNERFWIKDILKGDALIQLDKTNFSLTVMQSNKTDIPQTIVVKKEKAHELHAWLTDQLGLGWVSVEDRLPDYDVTCILLIDGDVFVGYYSKTFKSWYMHEEEQLMPCGFVTHWMPLPQPPEVQG
jgi:hypothetical protein